VGSVIEGLTPLGPDMLIDTDLASLRKMSVTELIQFAFRIGVPVRQLSQERGAILTEILRYSYDA
jgi:hypothetical protein